MLVAPHVLATVGDVDVEAGTAARPLLLADHIDAGTWHGRLLQRLIHLTTAPIAGEHLRRRPRATGGAEIEAG